METLHGKRDNEEPYTITWTHLLLAKAEDQLQTERKCRSLFENVRAWCLVPGVKKEQIYEHMTATLNEWDQTIKEQEKEVKELKEKSPELKDIGEQGGDETYLITERRYQYERAAAGLLMEKGRRETYFKVLEFWMGSSNINVREGLLKDVEKNLDVFDENIRILAQQVAEFAHKVAQQQHAKEGNLSNPPRSEIPDRSEGGKRMEEIENVQKEQGKDIGALKGDVLKITENVKTNTERINRLESGPPTAKHATPPESSKSVPDTHESSHQEAAKPKSGSSAPMPAKDPHPLKQDPPPVPHVDHLNRQKPVTALVEVDNGKQHVEQTKPSDGESSKPEAAAKLGSAEGGEVKKTQESTHPPSAPSNDAHPAGDATHHDTESSKPAESQPDSKGKAPLHGPQPEKLETVPGEHSIHPQSSKQAANVEQSHADTKAVNPPGQAKTTSDTKLQPKPAGESRNSDEIAHKSNKPSPSNDHQNSASTEPQPKSPGQPTAEHKEPTAPGHAGTNPLAPPAPDHKEDTTHARLDEHDAKIGNIDNNLQDVKDKQSKETAKHTAEVKQLKDHHEQQQVRIGKIEKDQAETSGKFNNLREDHDKRVNDLDIKHGELTDKYDTRFTSFENRLTSKEKDIGEISRVQDTHGNRLHDLETHALGYDHKFTTLESDVSHLKGQFPKHEEMFMKLPSLETNNDHTTQDLKLIKGKQDTTIQDVHSLKFGLGQTQTDLKHTYEGLNRVDAKAEKANTGITDLQQRVTTLEVGKGAGPNWGLVIGGAIAAVVAVGGVVGGFLWWKKKKATDEAGDSKSMSSDAGNGLNGRRRNQAVRNHAREWHPAFG